MIVKSDYIIFALGGASWPITGSNGNWRTVFENAGIKTKPFQSSNCGINIRWPEAFRTSHAGKPLKNINLFTDIAKSHGEAVITDYGIEGNAVYPLIHSVRHFVNSNKPTFIYIDFKPLNTEEQLLQKVKGQVIKTKDYRIYFNLTPVQLAIIKAFTAKDNFVSVAGFISSLKNLAIPVDSLRLVEEAISSVGGIDLTELSDDFSLRKYPGIYTIGEMVDWDAPTGGFLLQGCFSMGCYVAETILGKV